MTTPRIPRWVARPKPKPDRRRRAQHLAFIRQLACVACGTAAPSEAAHVRSGSDGAAGMKPSDRYSAPLCSSCHALQHQFGELTFWSTLRIDPLVVAFRLWAISGQVRGSSFGRDSEFDENCCKMTSRTRCACLSLNSVFSVAEIPIARGADPRPGSNTLRFACPRGCLEG
jgi:hypothetical protein